MNLLSGLERVPDHPECTAFRAVCLAADKRKYVTAEKLVKAIIKDKPNNPLAWSTSGKFPEYFARQVAGNVFQMTVRIVPISVLMTVFRTLKLRGHDPLVVMVEALVPM